MTRPPLFHFTVSYFLLFWQGYLVLEILLTLFVDKDDIWSKETRSFWPGIQGVTPLHPIAMKLKTQGGGYFLNFYQTESVSQRQISGYTTVKPRFISKSESSLNQMGKQRSLSGWTDFVRNETMPFTRKSKLNYKGKSHDYCC